MNSKKMNTGIIKDLRYLDHNMGDSHPETPKRLETIYKKIESQISYPLFEIKPRPAAKKEVLMVHTPAYYEQVKNSTPTHPHRPVLLIQPCWPQEE